MFNFNRKEKGQGLVEYALILVLIAIVVIGAMTLLGTKVSNTFGTVNAGLAGEGGGDDGEEAAAPTTGQAGLYADGQFANLSSYCQGRPDDEIAVIYTDRTGTAPQNADTYIGDSSGAGVPSGFVAAAQGPCDPYND